MSEAVFLFDVSAIQRRRVMVFRIARDCRCDKRCMNTGQKHLGERSMCAPRVCCLWYVLLCLVAFACAPNRCGTSTLLTSYEATNEGIVFSRCRVKRKICK